MQGADMRTVLYSIYALVVIFISMVMHYSSGNSSNNFRSGGTGYGSGGYSSPSGSGGSGHK